MPTVSEVTEPERLHQIRDAWGELLEQTPAADFFRTFDWLEVYWRHFGHGKSLRVLVIRERGKIVGLVPLVVEPYASKLGRFRTLSFPLDSWGSFYGPVGENPQELLHVALDYIRSVRREWDYVDLRWVAPSIVPAGGLKRSPATIHRRDTETSLVEISQTWDDYWASRSSNWRSNCRRNRKKLEKLGGAEHIRYRPSGEAGISDPRWDLHDQCEAIAQSSWQGHSTNGTTLTHASVRAFLRDVHARAAGTGCLDVNLLRVGGKAVAFNYNYVYRGYVSSLRLGFVPEHRQYGAGTVLTCLMLEDSFARGDHTFDFLPGSSSVKRPWRTHVTTSVRVESFPWQVSRVPLMHARRRVGQWAERAKSWWNGDLAGCVERATC